MHPIIEFLIVDKGIPETSIILILTLPIISSIVSIWRHIIGLRAFGIYAPILITFSFYHLSITPNGPDIVQGLKYGLALSTVVFTTAAITHIVTKKIRLHYLPKMSIVLSMVAAGVFALLTVAAYMNRGGFITIDALPILLLITVSEQFISFYIKKGQRAAYVMTVGTMLISIASYLLVAWDTLKNLLFRHPYLSLVTIIFILIIGKWTGFRITEYFRFKNIMKSESD